MNPVFFCWRTFARVRSAALQHADLRAFAEGRLNQPLCVGDHFTVLQVLDQERLAPPLGNEADEAKQAVSHEQVFMFMVFSFFIFES